MVFFYAMLVLALSDAVIAVGRTGAAINIPAALVTAYLVITSIRAHSFSDRSDEYRSRFVSLRYA